MHLSTQHYIRLYGFGEIEIPDFYFWEEGGDNGVVAFSGVVAVDGGEVDFEPFDVVGEGAEHDLVVDKEVVFILLVDVDL